MRVELKEIFKPDWKKIIIFFLFFMFLPIPYFDFNMFRFSFSSAGSYDIIFSLMAGEYIQPEFKAGDYFNITFLEIFVVAIAVSYVMSSFIAFVINRFYSGMVDVGER